MRNLSNLITSTFNIIIPAQPELPINVSWRTISIYIEYENPALSKVATSLWVNNKDFMGNEYYTMSGMNPIDTTKPVGLSLLTDCLCNNDNNKIIIRLNSNNFGSITAQDAVNNAYDCSSTKGHFYYQNNTLFGLDDDIANNIMDSSDALADISSYLVNGITTYSLNLKHKNYPFTPPIGITINPLFINAYTTPCDTFSTGIIVDTAICKGDSVQLFASGGTNYYWLPQEGLSNPSIAEPFASPDSTTIYIVQIENTPGCFRTEKVRVRVNEKPKINIYSISS